MMLTHLSIGARARAAPAAHTGGVLDHFIPCKPRCLEPQPPRQHEWVSALESAVGGVPLEHKGAPHLYREWMGMDGNGREWAGIDGDGMGWVGKG